MRSMTVSRLISVISTLLVSLLLSLSLSCGLDHPVLLVSINNWPSTVQKLKVSISLNGTKSPEGAFEIEQGQPGFVFDFPQGAQGIVVVSVLELDKTGCSQSLLDDVQQMIDDENAKATIKLALSLSDLTLCKTSETVPLNAMSGSGQSGTALLVDNGNNTTSVTISTSGGTDSGSQATHIHTGVCGSGGPIYAALNNVQSGSSTSIVSYSLSFLSGGKYYINIHNSTDLATIQSCGQIQ